MAYTEGQTGHLALHGSIDQSLVTQTAGIASVTGDLATLQTELPATFAPIVLRVPDPLVAFPIQATTIPFINASGSVLQGGVDRPVNVGNTGVAKWTGPVITGNNSTVTGTSGAIPSVAGRPRRSFALVYSVAFRI